MVKIKRSISLPTENSFFLFGGRQTGKTTLIRDKFKDTPHIIYNLLLESEYKRLISDISVFRSEVLSRNPEIKNIIIDEVQRIPELLNEVQDLMQLTENLYFGLSGSSARKLRRAGSNLLGGRAWNYSLYPLTHLELGKQFNLDKAINFGTLPSVYFSKDDYAAKKILRSYVSTYVNQEIRQEALIRNIPGFIRFLDVASELDGTLLNFSSIGRDCGVSFVTAKEYFQVLEDTLLGFFHLAYGGETSRRLKRQPKFYIFDLGVRRSLQGKLNLPIKPKTEEYGHYFESFIINEVHRLSNYNEADLELSYFKTSNNVEVDLIVKSPEGNEYAIEIKSSDNPHPASLNGLKSFAELRPKATLICACLAPRLRKIGSINVLPWQELFDILKLK